MVRKAPARSTGAQMYRHFAVLTIAVTVMVGVFADGESRKAVAGEVQPAPARASAHAGPTELSRRTTQPRGSFAHGDAFDASFGQPMDAAGASPQSGFASGDFADAPASGLPSSFNAYGISAEAWARMTEEQKRELAARHEAERGRAEEPARAKQIDSLTAASRRRAGTATAAD